MKRSYMYTAAVSFIVGALIAVLFPFISGALAHAQAKNILHVIDHSTNEATFNIPPDTTGNALGDQFYFANHVFNANNSKQIGRDQGYCFRMVGAAYYECHWTTYLPDGQISVDGSFNFPSDSVLAITGGTEKYIGAKGQMTLHPRDSKGAQYDFLFKFVE